MLALVTAPGLPESNAYCTLEEAEAYVSTLAFRKEWDAAGDGQKAAAIAQAARWMDTLPWRGARAAAEQPLAWPRRGAVDADGYEFPSDHTPKEVALANAEFAFRLLKKDRAGDAKYGVSLGSLQTKDQARHLVPDSVRDLAGRWLAAQCSFRVARS